MKTIDDAKLIAQLKLAKPNLKQSLGRLADTIIHNFDVDDAQLNGYSIELINDLLERAK